MRPDLRAGAPADTRADATTRSGVGRRADGCPCVARVARRMTQVDVTNASDKTQQLPKIPLLNEAVKEIMIEQATKKERLSQQGTEESAAKDGVDGEAESMDDSMPMMSMLGMGIPVPRMGRTSRVAPVEEVGVQEQDMPVEPVA